MGVEIMIGYSEKFNLGEIENAINAVLNKFKDFIGCELLELWYDEKHSESLVESYMRSVRGRVNGVNKENVIVLLSNFKTSKSSICCGFNPNSTYTDWQWILIRNNNTDNWIVDAWGY
jgi:hypothetical protein